MESTEIEIGRFYRHHDGGLYKVKGFRKGKVGDGPWVDGVDYEALNPEFPLFWTDLDRFCKRFSPEIPSEQHDTLN